MWRYDMFKLSEAVLAGIVARTCRMIEGLKAEGESIVPIVWSLTNGGCAPYSHSKTKPIMAAIYLH